MPGEQRNYLGAATLSLIPVLLSLLVVVIVSAESTNTPEIPNSQVLDAGMYIYIEHCIVCHGSEGLGTEVYPALDDPAIRSADREYLISTITLGHEGTAMVGFGMEVTGRLTDEEIASVIDFVQHGDWSQVVANIPPTPTPAPTEPVVVDAELTSASEEGGAETVEHDPEFISVGAEAFLDNCSDCHGLDMTGGPGVADLTSRQIQRKSDEDLLEIIRLGVDGTEMAGWRAILTPEEIDAIMIIIRNPELLN